MADLPDTNVCQASLFDGLPDGLPGPLGLDGAGRPITRTAVRKAIFDLDQRLLATGGCGLAGAAIWAVFGPIMEELGIAREYLVQHDTLGLVDADAQAEFVKAIAALGTDKPNASAGLKALASAANDRMLARCP